MKKLNYLFSLLCFMTISTWAFAQPVNNECSGAIDLSSNLGQGAGNTVTTGSFDNSTATTEASDPTTGFDCFADPSYGAPEALQNTLWFKVIGDGNLYDIVASSNTGTCATSDPIDANDTQIAVYSGACGNLTPVNCNEDGPNASTSNYLSELSLNTEAGLDYYIMVDGFDCSATSCGGALSTGEFCLSFTQTNTVLCNDPDVSGGTISVEPAIVCQPDSIALFSYDGTFGPNEGDVFGYQWIVSTSDLVGSVNPTADPSYFGAFPVASSPATNPGINLLGNEFPVGIYYFTLYAFGNATEDPMAGLVFDPACTFASNSFKLEYYPEDACPITSVLDVDKAVLGMTVFPNPVKDVINLNINAQEQYSEAILMITNVTGQVVDQQRVNLLSGANTFDVNVSDMPSGVYMVSIESETHQSVTKFVKQ